MIDRIFRDKSEPLRERLSWDEMWKGPDRGLIQCWEVGRRIARDDAIRSESAKRGELPSSNWKGGITGNPKFKKKYGPLSYLAEWQGLRGENLDIDLENETEVVCSRTGIRVIFTPDMTKYSQP
jgi:hypothetical protein